jgi:cold shock CspA family protein
MNQGTVQHYNSAKAYGFIADETRNYFFHQRHVDGGFILRPGDRVQFRPGPSATQPGKFQGFDITLIERAVNPEVRA